MNRLLGLVVRTVIDIPHVMEQGAAGNDEPRRLSVPIAVVGTHRGARPTLDMGSEQAKSRFDTTSRAPTSGLTFASRSEVIWRPVPPCGKCDGKSRKRGER